MDVDDEFQPTSLPTKSIPSSKRPNLAQALFDFLHHKNIIDMDEKLERLQHSAKENRPTSASKQRPMIPETDEIIHDNFLRMSTNDSVQPLKGIIRPGYEEMYGIFARREIKREEIILSWCGVVVAAADFETHKKEIANYQHVLEYAMEYEHPNGEGMVVCPRLNKNGFPDPTRNTYFDSCWACLINEPMSKTRTRVYYDHKLEKHVFKHQTVRVKKNSANARIAVAGGLPIIVACENIAKGDEITMRYSENKSGKHSYSGGYPVGDHPVHPHKWCKTPRVVWSDIKDIGYPSPPTIVKTRYLLMEYHNIAHAIEEKIREMKEKHMLDELQYSNESKGLYADHVSDICTTWQNVVKAIEETFYAIKIHDLSRKRMNKKIQLLNLIFSPIGWHPEWNTALRKKIKSALFMNHENKLVYDTMVYIWKSIKTYGENLRCIRLTAKKSVGIRNLMTEHHTEPEVLQAGPIFQMLDTVCAEFSAVKNFDEFVSDEMMLTMRIYYDGITFKDIFDDKNHSFFSETIPDE